MNQIYICAVGIGFCFGMLCVIFKIVLEIQNELRAEIHRSRFPIDIGCQPPQQAAAKSRRTFEVNV